MNRWLSIKNITCLATVWLLFVSASLAQDQQNSTESTEVYLTFQYRGVVSSYVTSHYKDEQFYLPVSELFNQLQIQHRVNQGTLSISGNYLGEKSYLLNFNNQTARAGDTEIPLEPDDFIIKEIDYFVKASIFEELFGLQFSTNFNNLTLDLETEDKMPVFAQYEREQNRKRIDQQQISIERDLYPLQYDRQHQILDGTFLDYNLTGVYSSNSQLFNFSNSLGGELLGGDVQGNFFGTLSDKQHSFTTNGLRWRYVQRGNSYFSSGILGQTNTEGISNRPVTGFKISNKPVEPRRLFDRYVIDGNVEPQSEVELYLNNRLIDFQEADDSGNYRFVVPLRYGSTEYGLQIYEPSGESIERNSRIQIPFDYVPTGSIDYSISGGQLENPILGSTERGYVGAASISTGVADWLTTQISTEYLSAYHESLPSLTGTLNARLLSKYLISANINSDNFYRLTSSVVYSSGTSWSFSYDYNPGDSQLYNIGGNDHQARVNLFTPFQIGSLPLNVRWTTSYQQNGDSKFLRYRADLNTRLRQLNIRLGYRDQQATPLDFITTTGSRITNSYTYSIGRFNDVSQLFRGIFIRGQLSYLPALKKLEEAEFQLSRDLLDTGRMQFTFGRNFLGNFNSLSLTLTVDFNNLRSNTTSRATGSQYSVTQSVRGSVNYDSNTNQFLLKNRQQVGQSGAAVRLFVDNNNDGSYQEEIDNIINDPAVRLNRAGGRTSVKNGVNYISQLLPYYRYNLEVNKGALSNPLLVPDVENFSLITDPNQYKAIEIPFYLSGVISGRVMRKQNGELNGLGGLRLYLESQDNDEAIRDFSEEIRTFSDGSYYLHEVPPGKYNLFIDPSQLEFLNAVSDPDTMQIEVESLAEGDFIENLNFIVTPKMDEQ